MSGYMMRSAQARYRAERAAEQLEIELKVLIEIHEMLSAPWADENDVKGHLTRRKNAVRNKLKKAREIAA